MSWVNSNRNGTAAGSSTTLTLSVPTGVTTAHAGLLVLAGSTPAPASFTITGSGVTVSTVIAPVAANNMWFAAYKIKNVAAGTVLTITGNIANLFSAAIHFFTSDYVAGTLGTRGGVTQAFVNAPSLAALDGLRCWVVASDRATAGTAVSSTTNANGNPVTQRYYNDPNVSNEGQVSFYLGEFVSNTTGATGQSVVTWNGTSGNAAALHIAEVTPLPIKVWDGAAWVRKPIKVWTGTGWVIKPVKVWDGAAWKTLA